MNKKSECQILYNGSWQIAKTKTQDLDKDFSNPINCTLDLNIASNNSKIILITEQNQIKLNANDFKLAISTLLQEEPTKQAPLFVAITTYKRQQRDLNSFTFTTTTYQVTKILKPQMIHVRRNIYIQKLNYLSIVLAFVAIAGLLHWQYPHIYSDYVIPALSSFMTMPKASFNMIITKP